MSHGRNNPCPPHGSDHLVRIVQLRCHTHDLQQPLGGFREGVEFLDRRNRRLNGFIVRATAWGPNRAFHEYRRSRHRLFVVAGPPRRQARPTYSPRSAATQSFRSTPSSGRSPRPLPDPRRPNVPRHRGCADQKTRRHYALTDIERLSLCRYCNMIGTSDRNNFSVQSKDHTRAQLLVGGYHAGRLNSQKLLSHQGPLPRIGTD